MKNGTGSEPIGAVVLGATGYVGGELLRLLTTHPVFALEAAVSESRQGQPIAATFPNLAGAYAAERFAGHDDWISNIEPGSRVALFSAAPHGASAALVAAALEASGKRNLDVHVVDASADFRYAAAADYAAIYGAEHGAPGLLGAFSCAVPEHAPDVRTPHVGHPGCFATAVLLATVPLVASGLAEDEVFVTATTGSTGSGRSPQPGTHHPERHGNLYAYKPLAHRHAPEIAGLTAAATGRSPRVHFVPQSGPFARGIYATVHARAREPVTVDRLREFFEKTYAAHPFIDVVPGTPRLKHVVTSNRCEIGIATDGEAIAVMSAIDNLVKGAAGGAVQWMNRLWDQPETAGLTAVAPAWT
ncbi:MAG: N-acetyl-gamma-glutamyl-phosphate reductase [Woeseiaceae bacterium]|nr:N-acetyl-gamma-glutamyl-phosphate reductase [Woeseiaceae bacterium]